MSINKDLQRAREAYQAYREGIENGTRKPVLLYCDPKDRFIAREMMVRYEQHNYDTASYINANRIACDHSSSLSHCYSLDGKPDPLYRACYHIGVFWDTYGTKVEDLKTLWPNSIVNDEATGITLVLDDGTVTSINIEYITEAEFMSRHNLKKINRIIPL
jgi:hypothetical protein